MESKIKEQLTAKSYKKLIMRFERKGFKFLNVIPINCHRYIIARFEEKNILITFKKEPFHSFGRLFADYGFTGPGDTINVTDLKYSSIHNVEEIYSIFADGKVYSISIKDFLTNAVKWTTDESDGRKEVYSMPLNLYNREENL